MSSSSLLPSCPPEGIIIHRHWRIGKQLGAGGCGSVHELIRDDGSSRSSSSAGAPGPNAIVHAIKLTPLPDYTSSNKVTKKENAERKTFADILHYESLIYQNQLVDLRGTLIPELPLRPATGDVGGRYAILEYGYKDCRTAAVLVLIRGVTHTINFYLPLSLVVSPIQCNPVTSKSTPFLCT
jgi:hypothetical protein